MNEKAARKILWSAAMIALLAGIGLTVQTSRHFAQLSAAMERKIVSLDKLKVLESDLATCDQARRATEKEGGRPAQPLQTLLQEFSPGLQVEECHESRREAAPGWDLRQTEMVLRDVSFASSMDLVKRAEAQRPPWRLARCTFRVSPSAAGTGEATLLFEALERPAK